MKPLVAALTGLLLLVGGCSDPDPDDADVAFTQQMLAHHEQALEMSDLVAGADASPEVEDLAERISAAQGPEIETMRGWLADWDVEPDAAGSMGSMDGMMSGAEMADLDRATGAAFDRAWLTMMVEHHAGAVAMAEVVIDEGEDPDVRALAEDVARTQQAEITEMEGLLDD